MLLLVCLAASLSSSSSSSRALHICLRLSARAPKAPNSRALRFSAFFDAWLPRQSSPLEAPGLLQSTLHEEPQLAELVTQEAGSSTEIELKVIRNDIVHYKYTVKANQAQVLTQKVQIVLQSKQAAQYCLGIARLQRKDETELKKVRERYQIGTTWRFKAITIFNDKPAYIHTSCRIAIDLRKSQAQALLQSTSFLQTPLPTVTIAEGMMRKLQQISKVQSANPDTSCAIAWQQRKCRRLVRYPTVS